MYLQHYNLEQLPFRNTPDPRFYLATEKHNEALANLVYAVEQRRGFVLLTGEIGSGKTLVTHLLLQRIEDHALVALIRNTHLNSTQLIRLICDEFAVQVGSHDDKASMLLNLNQFLIQQLAEDRLVVILIDEAQNLSDRVLEELRMLSNLETSTEKLIQIVLVGQPELRDKISQPQLEQLRTRIALAYHLEALGLDEVTRYIAHRLKVAGERHTVAFTPGAVERVARFSRGTPRVINGLCDNALLYGFTAGTQVIDEELIEKVLRQSMHMAPRQRVGPVRTPTYGRREAVGRGPGEEMRNAKREMRNGKSEAGNGASARRTAEDGDGSLPLERDCGKNTKGNEELPPLPRTLKRELRTPPPLTDEPQRAQISQMPGSPPPELTGIDWMNRMVPRSTTADEGVGTTPSPPTAGETPALRAPPATPPEGGTPDSRPCDGGRDARVTSPSVGAALPALVAEAKPAEGTREAGKAAAEKPAGDAIVLAVPADVLFGWVAGEEG